MYGYTCTYPHTYGKTSTRPRAYPIILLNWRITWSNHTPLALPSHQRNLTLWRRSHRSKVPDLPKPSCWSDWATCRRHPLMFGTRLEEDPWHTTRCDVLPRTCGIWTSLGTKTQHIYTQIHMCMYIHIIYISACIDKSTHETRRDETRWDKMIWYEW